MNIAEDQLARLRNFGYTEAEARFLYLVATHSGYFTVRQFLDFAKAKSGKRNADGRSNGITFADRFPLCVAYPSPDYMPVVTFTYVDPDNRNLDAYIVHLRMYRPLFRQLPGFQFLYISTAAGLQKEAAELFSLLVEGKGLSDLIRYFDLETKWEREQYRLVTEQDAIFLSQARNRYTGDSISTLYYLWRRNQLPKDFQAEAAPAPLSMQKILFRAITVPGHAAIFGDTTK